MQENRPIWEDGGWDGLAPLAGDESADVCVVGLGGSGLSCVLALLEAGLDVVGVDAGGVGAGAGGRNGGFLLAGAYHFYHDAVDRHGRARARELYVRTVAEIERMSAETPEAVRRTGSLRIAASPDEAIDCAAQLAEMRRDALPVEPYSGPEGEGLLIPTDAAFDPLRRCRLLAHRAVERGARLYEHTRATEIAGDRVLSGPHPVRCGAVVVAVDGSLERVLPELAGRVRTARLQMLATGPAPEVRVPRPTYYRWGLEYWQQLPDHRVALGGFRDRGGPAEWTFDASPSAPVQRLLETLLRERLGVTAPVSRRWAAGAAFTSDGLPVVDEVRPSVWAIGGYSGTGNVIGSLCGRSAASLVQGLPAWTP